MRVLLAPDRRRPATRRSLRRSERSSIDAPGRLRYLAPVFDQLFPLEPLGITIVDGNQPELHAACVRAARLLRFTGRRAIGLLPASSEVAVLPVGIQLCGALTQLCGATIAYVDANPRWPALPLEALRSMPATYAGGFAVRWIGPHLALLTPHGERAAGAGVVLLDQLLGECAATYEHLIVDLTGFRELGEHLTAIRSLDGVVVVARAGFTHEADLLKLNHALPADRNLGVLLVGGRSA